MSARGTSLCVWLLTLGLAAAGGRSAAAQQPLARAVLFYSPTCPHCHKVIEQDLPGIFAAVGGEPRFYRGTAGHVLVNEGLSLLLVNVAEPAGRALYDEVSAQYHIPDERMGVPRLLCRDSILVGDLDIPVVFPRLIQAGRAAGGTSWPAIPGLATVFPPGYDPGLGAPVAARPVPAADSGTAPPPVAPPRDSGAAAASSAAPVRPAPTDSAPPPPAPRQPAHGTTRARPDSLPDVATADTTSALPRSDSVRTADTAAAASGATGAANLFGTQRGIVLFRTFGADPVGASLALLLLVVMLTSLVWIGVRPPGPGKASRTLTVPVLVLAGVAISAYLGYVEATGAAAVCGPVGDCNAVQQSAYARLFGVVPVAFVGLAGYVAILAAWGAARLARGALGAWGAAGAFVLALVGTAASVVFTVLEPFVIGAVCLWCLGSAAVMTALLWLLAGPGLAAARAAPWRGAAGPP
jgi:uncharacterized membrane protein